jgi:hypothetical protein
MKRIIISFLALVALGACTRHAPTEATPPQQPSADAVTAIPAIPGPLCNSYAFIGFQNNVSNRGVLILDISRPENPAVVCSIPGTAPRVEYSGRTMCFNSNFYDIRDPAHPGLLSIIDTMNVSCISLRSTTAYLACGGMNNRKLVVADISDPAHPRRLGSCMLNNELWGIATKGNYVYVANHWNGLRVIDVRNPANPHEVACLLNGEAVAEDLVIDGKYVYLCQQDKVSIIDISDPLAPVRVSAIATGCLYWACVADRYVYVANGYDGIKIVDVHDPVNPRFVSQLDLPGRTMRVAVSGDYAYAVGDNGSGLRIVNIKNRQRPFLMKTLLTDHSIYDITLYRPGRDLITSNAAE